MTASGLPFSETIHTEHVLNFQLYAAFQKCDVYASNGQICSIYLHRKTNWKAKILSV